MSKSSLLVDIVVSAPGVDAFGGLQVNGCKSSGARRESLEERCPPGLPKKNCSLGCDAKLKWHCRCHLVTLRLETADHRPKNCVGVSPITASQLFSQTQQLTNFHPFSCPKLHPTSSHESEAYNSLLPGRFLNRLQCEIHSPGKYMVPSSPETCSLDNCHLGSFSAGCRYKCARE